MECRICYERQPEEELIHPCACTGTMAKVHHSCLKTWILHKQQQADLFLDPPQCEMCKQHFRIERRPLGFKAVLRNCWRILYSHNFFLFKGTLYSVYLYIFTRRTIDTVRLIGTELVRKKALRMAPKRLFFIPISEVKEPLRLRSSLLEAFKFLYYLIILL